MRTRIKPGRHVPLVNHSCDEPACGQAGRPRPGFIGVRRVDEELRWFCSWRCVSWYAIGEELAAVGRPSRRPSPECAPPLEPDYDVHEVRQWAFDNGVPCPTRGRLPAEVVQAWRAAGGDAL